MIPGATTAFTPRLTRPLDQARHVSILVSVEMDVAVDHKIAHYNIAAFATFRITHARTGGI